MRNHSSKRSQAGPMALVLSLIATGIAIALWITVAAHLMFIVPEKRRLFDEFRLKLPRLTMVVIQTSNWLVNYWYVVGLMFVFFSIALVLITWWLAARSHRKWPALLWCLLQLIIPLLVHGVIWFSWYMPMQGLVNALK